jgi:lysophospholipase L1-like esterase
VTIYYGTNDSGFYSFEYTRWNLEYMVNAAKTAGAQVYIATLQPAFAPWAWRQPFMMEISAIVRNIAAENAVTFVDLEAAFNWNSSLIGADGLHPNDAGQQLIATVFRSSIPGL